MNVAIISLLIRPWFPQSSSLNISPAEQQQRLRSSICCMQQREAQPFLVGHLSVGDRQQTQRTICVSPFFTISCAGTLMC